MAGGGEQDLDNSMVKKGLLEIIRFVVNFINILRAAFATIFFPPKNCKAKTVTREKLCKTLLYKKFENKMLMKLTPVYDINDEYSFYQIKSRMAKVLGVGNPIGFVNHIRNKLGIPGWEFTKLLTQILNIFHNFGP